MPETGMDRLPLFFDINGKPVLLLGSGNMAEAKARLIEGAGGRVVRAIEPDVRLAFIALDDAALAAQEAERLRATGLLVNVVDRAELCDFTVPAIIDRSPVMVAIGTAGASATLAKVLRERLEALLPSGLGGLARAIGGARREIAVRLPTPDARRRFWDRLLAPGGALDPFADIDDPAARIADGEKSSEPDSLVIISASDPDDLTLRELRGLSTADTLFHVPGAAAAVLDRARRDARRVVCDSPPDPLPPGRSVFVKG